MASLINNVKTLFSTPRMLPAWINWNLRGVGFKPKVSQPLGGFVLGFRSFSEYWGAIYLVPADSEVAFIQRYSGDAGVMIDVGANLGCMTLTMSRARPMLEVHCFEPSPETFAILQDNLRYNQAGKAHPHAMAVGASIGRTSFINSAETAYSNRMTDGLAATDGPVVEVDVISLDEFVSGLAVNEVAFLKVDVEGHEPEVIRGAADILKNKSCRCALIELCPRNLISVGSSMADLLTAVDEVGFGLYFLMEDGSPGERVNVENSLNVDCINVAMLPDGGVV